jgi:hypothetical protein
MKDIEELKELVMIKISRLKKEKLAAKGNVSL